jgi:hypothetical protein
MKKIRFYLLCLITPALLSAVVSDAQGNKTQTVLKAPAAPVTIDADLKEWGDSLQFHNADNNIRYAFTNDKDNLYFAIRLDDRSQAIRVLKAGFTLNIDPKGKKKGAYAITFPLSTQLNNPPPLNEQLNFNEVTQTDRDELARETITTLRGIKVEGFKEIDGDMITTSNTYGIKAVLNYDDKGNLVCEIAIAFKLLHADSNPKKEWLYAITINGINRSMPNKEGQNAESNGGRGGMGGGRGSMGSGGMGGGRVGRGGGNRASTQIGGADKGVLGKSIEIDGKFLLANAQ